MFISHKNNVIQSIHEVEWQCRRMVKGLSKSEYWVWLESVTTDGVVDYSDETDYTIIKCKHDDEDVEARLAQLSEYIVSGEFLLGSGVYNITWSDDKVDCEEILDVDGKSYSPKKYVKSHFKGDDSAKDARLLATQWKLIRAERDRLIAETDWMMLSDTGTVSAAWKNYRKALRDIPSSQDSVKVFSDIDWPDKPSS